MKSTLILHFIFSKSLSGGSTANRNGGFRRLQNEASESLKIDMPQMCHRGLCNYLRVCVFSFTVMLSPLSTLLSELLFKHAVRVDTNYGNVK